MDINQALDQFDALMRDMTPLIRKHYNRLKAEGFSDFQAHELTKEYQRSIVATVLGGKK